MTGTGLEGEIRDLAVELFPAPPFWGDDPLEEFAWDSLALEQLIAAIEEKYLILLDTEDVARAHFRSVPVLAGVVRRRIDVWDSGP
jgi:hypothetical protein